MEVEKTHDPESNFEFLVLQVDEQSEFCDVTVISGDWKKRFHRCVLTASLLFQTIVDIQIGNAKTGNVLEKHGRIQDTKLEIMIDTSPDVVEMAIMFLYGKVPAFTISNIGDLLELAEYLIIPSLKHACIDWLEQIDYSKVNCMHVIKLSTKFDFDIKTCKKYIESHIPETFLLDEAVDLSFETVEYFFRDKRFSYVDMDVKLGFLIKWANKHPKESMKISVSQVIDTIDLKEVSINVLEKAKNNATFNSLIDLENRVCQSKQDYFRKRVLIMASGESYFACLDLQESRWYRLHSRYFDRYRYREEIIGVRNDNPEVCMEEVYSSKDIMTTVDLESDEIRTYRLQLELDYFTDKDEDIVDVEIAHVNLSNDIVVAVVQITVQIFVHCDIHQDVRDNFSSGDERECQDIINAVLQTQVCREISSNENGDYALCVVHLPGTKDIVEPSAGSSSSSYTRNVTSLFIGNTSEEDVETQPVFSFRNEIVTQMCMNNRSVLAMLTKSDNFVHVILYDVLNYKMDRLLTLQKKEYEICPSDNGFIIYNDTNCFCLTKLSIPFFSKTYKIETLRLENGVGWFIKYRYQCGLWIRILRRSLNDDLELQCVSHEELAMSHSSQDVNWKNMPIPEDNTLFENRSDLENAFVVPLSKRKLRCDIACPHCK
ncbi:uncharacterized protein LOC132752896 [Ruditapes philippinarum]|uniref:uncharacterized protein LOC132752896 n=1 Tax=Ruditapes philippinarum TaxID=129788 RepID=UPI00295A59E7|nr:uncharacterized protein LOC132752896 [Ruditapes philippinarum]XP_060599285.1 uncharacterized protein LOC132752896 [Ruditapes philippinarum]